MGIRKDLTGQRFGRLVAQYSLPERNSRRYYVWKCVCDCGNEVELPTDRLTCGNTKSCGCLQADARAANGRRNLRHGMAKHDIERPKLYMQWRSMIDRCKDTRLKVWSVYGGRGITVCDEWANSFEAYRDFAYANGYKDGLTIDRINNEDGYFPDNVRFVTCKENQRNKRNNRNVTIGGVTRCVSAWAEIFHLTRTVFTNRLNKGLTGIDLVRGGKL